jgi:hypothetical protein
MEAMLGISIYSYPYLKLAKMLSFLLLLISTLQQNWEVRGKRGGKAGGRNGPNNVCHMNK